MAKNRKKAAPTAADIMRERHGVLREAAKADGTLLLSGGAGRHVSARDRERGRQGRRETRSQLRRGAWD